MTMIPKSIKSIARESWAVSWPMTLIMFYVFILGITDVFVAGKFGKEVQASYGLAFQLYFIFIMIAIALVIGVVSVVSRLFTSENKDEFYSSVCTSLISSIALGIVFGIGGMIFTGPIISRLGIPGPIKAYTITFLIIYSVGFVFDYLLIVSNGILRACNMIKYQNRWCQKGRPK